jgi:hypothetical protein
MRKLTEQDLTALVGSVHSGYTILRARVKCGNFSDSDHYGIALGRNAVDNYVTWQFHLEDETPSMYWGHYTDSEEKAIADYEARDQ